MEQLFTTNTRLEDADPERIKELRAVVIPFQMQHGAATLSMSVSAMPQARQVEKWLRLQADRPLIRPRIVKDEESKTLTERFNEAYDEEARQEDEEFVENVKKYQRKRFSDEW